MKNTPTFVICKKYSLTIKAVSEKSDSLPVTDLDIQVVGTTVVGQDELIKGIATSLYNAHYMGIKCVEFIMGGSGTGKTLTMESFCKEMGLVYTIENATQYTQEGYVGESVDKMLVNLFEKSKGDFSKAENGMLIIDEIGKKTSKSRGNTESAHKVEEATEVPAAQPQSTRTRTHTH